MKEEICVKEEVIRPSGMFLLQNKFLLFWLFSAIRMETLSITKFTMFLLNFDIADPTEFEYVIQSDHSVDDSKYKQKQDTKINSEGFLFDCSHCGYKCITDSDLKQHVCNPTRKKTDYKNKRKSSLTEHLLIRTKEKPFQCTYCNYRCSSKGTLSKHFLIHTKEKPFQCTYCDYRCNRKSSLTDHLSNHTGEKLFQCTVCDYKCNRKSSLTRHLYIHTGEKPFKCTYCNYMCSRKGKLTEQHLIHANKKKLFSVPTAVIGAIETVH